MAVKFTKSFYPINLPSFPVLQKQLESNKKSEEILKLSSRRDLEKLGPNKVACSTGETTSKYCKRRQLGQIGQICITWKFMQEWNKKTTNQQVLQGGMAQDGGTSVCLLQPS